MLIGVVKETFPGERRVALVPSSAQELARKKHKVLLQTGAGVAAGYPDAQYAEKGAELVAERAEVLRRADIVVQVRGLGANTQAGAADLAALRNGQLLVAFLDPLGSPKDAQRLADTGVTAFAMELMPRITRAQSMDALSSMATLSGYRAVLLAATHLPKIFPMMMTAAGSISPARVFVLGAGVAGLQAIATAKRLGAVVEGYDVRPEVKEQVQSVGGKFVELPIEAADAGDKGGYAKAQSEDFYRRQQELLTKHVVAADVVITTAAVPGRKAPVLVTKAMVEGMRPGSVVVDLAAESGGNCELARAGENVDVGGVLVMGPTNVPSSIPFHASQMYAKNVTNLLLHLSDKEGRVEINMEDEITRGALLARDKVIANERVVQLLKDKGTGG